MDTGRRSSVTRIALACATLVLAAFYAWTSVRLFVATVLARQMSRPALEEAIRLAPLHPEYRDRLGYQFLYIEQDPQKAAEAFRSGIELAPTSASGWIGLAKTQFSTGDTPASVASLDRAIALDPKGTGTVWEAGNLYLVMGETRKGLNQIRTASNTDASYAGDVMETAWRSTRNVDLVLDEALPREMGWRQSFVIFLISRQQTEPAMRAWQRLVELRQPLTREKSFFYIDYLIGQGRAAEAYRSWRDYLELSETARAKDDNDIVFNSGFENPVLNGGFDWRTSESDDIAVSLDQAESHSGSQSLCIEIKPTRISQLPLFQYVHLDPNTRYKFRAYIRADLTTADGPRFVIGDALHGALATTPEVVDGQKWTEVTADLATLANTGTGFVRLVRDRGDTLIRGKVWIDDVTLTKELPR